MHEGGVYATTQGPSFETAQEINRIEKDGCDVVGMTGLPEAALAAEKRLCYDSVNLIVNTAEGRGKQDISMHEISESWRIGRQKVSRLILVAIQIILEIGPESFQLNSRVMEV